MSLYDISLSDLSSVWRCPHGSSGQSAPSRSDIFYSAQPGNGSQARLRDHERCGAAERRPCDAKHGHAGRGDQAFAGSGVDQAGREWGRGGWFPLQVYHYLLRLYPAEFTVEFGQEMEDVFSARTAGPAFILVARIEKAPPKAGANNCYGQRHRGIRTVAAGYGT